jgi:hypothetical protein
MTVLPLFFGSHVYFTTVQEVFATAEPSTGFWNLKKKIHNYTAEKKLLHKQRARKSHDLPAKVAAGRNGST